MTPGRRAGDEPGPSLVEQADVFRVEAVDVLQGVDRVEDASRSRAGRQRELHEDPVDAGVRVGAARPRRGGRPGRDRPEASASRRGCRLRRRPSPSRRRRPGTPGSRRRGGPGATEAPEIPAIRSRACSRILPSERGSVEKECHGRDRDDTASRTAQRYRACPPRAWEAAQPEPTTMASMGSSISERQRGFGEICQKEKHRCADRGERDGRFPRDDAVRGRCETEPRGAKPRRRRRTRVRRLRPSREAPAARTRRGRRGHEAPAAGLAETPPRKVPKPDPTYRKLSPRREGGLPVSTRSRDPGRRSRPLIGTDPRLENDKSSAAPAWPPFGRRFHRGPMRDKGVAA